jgi:hypothetical protein
MAYKADIAQVEKLVGTVVGTGQCAVLVQQVAGAPATRAWKQGKKVKGDLLITKGVAIATFNTSGKYPNKMDGSSHAAIYISQTVVGIDVYDQWLKQPVHKRTIRFRNNVGFAVDDGDRFFVIE